MTRHYAMMKLAFVLALAACGTSPDERDPSLEVMTLEVLAPSCGQVQCHSTSTRTAGYALDTVKSARESLPDLLLSERGSTEPRLLEVLHADGDRRMPPDSPLPEEDIALIKAWVLGGAQGL